MSRLVVALLVLALHAAPGAQVPQGQPQQADGIVRLLADLETALTAERTDPFHSLTSASLPPAEASVFDDMRIGQGVATAAVRERDRRPVGDGFVVVADVLVGHDYDGRVATWEITAHPSGRARQRFEITGLKELAVVDGLIKLVMDPSRQFTVHNLVFTAPDLTLKMASGSAFIAKGTAGGTAVVLRGRGELHFAPPDPAEQGQLRIFARQPQLDTQVDQVFLRLHPADFQARVSEHSLVPARLDPNEAERAQEIFDSVASRTYNLNLTDLSTERWSLLPTYGNVALEFRSARFGWLTYARSLGDAEDVTLFDRAHSHNISLYASAEKIAARGLYYDEDAGAAYDVLNYGLEVTFDPFRSWISGRGQLHLRVLAETAKTLTVRLAETLTVTSITSPELGRLLAMRVIGQTSVIVNLPVAVNRGDELTLVVTYSGRLESQELSREAMAPEARLSPRARGPAAATQDDFRVQVVQAPEPRYMYSNRIYWYPQAPATDYALATMRLTVPAEYQIVASGSLIGSSVAPSETLARTRGDTKYARTAEYFTDRPVRYLSCVISRFVPIGRATVPVPAIAPSMAEGPTRSGDGSAPAVYLEVVSTPRQASANRQLPSRAADVLKFYSGLFGEAPYPNLTVLAADALLPGGHSPAFVALIQQPLVGTPYSWQDDPLAFDRFPNFTLAHEIAHQWWGQAIGFKNYHEQWLSEGLAQYSALMFLSVDRPDIGRQMLGQMRASAVSLTGKGPIYLGYRLGHLENRGAIFRGIIYNKSALVLHMLRQLVGDEAFTRGLRRFYHDWRFKKAGTDDLRAAFEAETGQSLGRFIDRWVMGSSLPQLRITTRVEDEGRTAHVRVDQIGEVFDVPLTLSIQYADGRSDDVMLPLSTATTERQISLKGPLRKIVPREELILADFVN